jgi:polyphosphate kinase
MNPYVFGKGEEEEICLGSADDLMQRNLDRRVEQNFPARGRDKVRGLLKLQLAHTSNAWELRPDGSFVRLHQGGD